MILYARLHQVNASFQSSVGRRSLREDCDAPLRPSVSRLERRDLPYKRSRWNPVDLGDSSQFHGGELAGLLQAAKVFSIRQRRLIGSTGARAKGVAAGK
jgi:hypothetical protein